MVAPKVTLDDLNRNVPYPKTDLVGKRTDRLVVRAFAGAIWRKNGRARKNYWICDCDCGSEALVETGHINRGQRSCGCAITTHGLTNHPCYVNWKRMMERCYNKKDEHYCYYGAAGISVCDRWHDIANFIADMGEPPDGKHTVDRIDNEHGYEPTNCRWATRQEQSRNRDHVRKYEHDGRSLYLPEWASIAGIGYKTLHYRLTHGWSFKDAISKPLKGKKIFASND